MINIAVRNFSEEDLPTKNFKIICQNTTDHLKFLRQKNSLTEVFINSMRKIYTKNDT